MAVNHMEPGEHFITKPAVSGGGGVGGGGGGGGGAAAAAPPVLPPLTALPLYDLHMRRVVGPPAGLLYRGKVLEGVADEEQGLCRWARE